VRLSSSEAEYIAISEALKVIKFIYFLLREIGIEVNLRITVKTDNVDAMFMVQYASSGVRVTLIHVIITSERIWKKELSISNLSSQLKTIPIFSIFTKNFSQYKKHVTKFLGVHAQKYMR
jgi:hypothetical protein